MFSEFQKLNTKTLSRCLCIRLKAKQLFFALLAVAWLTLTPATAQVVPSNMQIQGEITSSVDGPPVTDGSLILVINQSTQATEGQGSVLSDDGTYFIDLSKNSDFNGTRLTMHIQLAGSVFQLLNGSSPISFQYTGSFPFPTRLILDATVGEFVSSVGGGGTGSVSSGGGGSTAREGDIINDNFDVNQDGVFNQVDIDMIKDSITSSNPSPRADVNGDGVINTRDAITAIRFWTSVRRRGSRSVTVERATSSDDGGDSSTDGSNSDSGTAQ